LFVVSPINGLIQSKINQEIQYTTRVPELTRLYAVNFLSKKKASQTTIKCISLVSWFQAGEYNVICLKIAKLYNCKTVLLNKRRITSFIDISLFSKDEHRLHWTRKKQPFWIVVFYPLMQTDDIWTGKLVIIFLSSLFCLTGISFTVSVQKRK